MGILRHRYHFIAAAAGLSALVGLVVWLVATAAQPAQELRSAASGQHRRPESPLGRHDMVQSPPVSRSEVGDQADNARPTDAEAAARGPITRIVRLVPAGDWILSGEEALHASSSGQALDIERADTLGVFRVRIPESAKAVLLDVRGDGVYVDKPQWLRLGSDLQQDLTVFREGELQVVIDGWQWCPAFAVGVVPTSRLPAGPADWGDACFEGRIEVGEEGQCAFRFGGLRAGAYRVMLVARAKHEAIDADTLDSHSVILTSGREHVVHLGPDHRGGYSLSGIVSQHSTPIVGAELELNARVYSGDDVVSRTITGQDGAYFLDVPAPGRYELNIRSDRTAFQVPIEIDRPITTRDVELPGLAIRGAVFGCEGNVRVVAEALDSPLGGVLRRHGAVAWTGRDGRFSIEGLFPGEYRVTALEDVPHRAFSDFVDSASVLLDPGGSNRPIQLRRDERSEVEVVVRGPDGALLAGAMVFLRLEDEKMGGWVVVGRSDDQGRIAIDVPHGHRIALYCRRVQSPDDGPTLAGAAQSVDVGLDASRVVLVDCEIAAELIVSWGSEEGSVAGPASFRSQVWLESGLPMVGGGPQVYAAKEFRIPGVIPGLVTVAGARLDGATAQVRLDVQPGETTRVVIGDAK